MPGALFNTLLVERIREGELEHVLSSYFGGAREAGPNRIDYPNGEGEPAIQVVYDGARIVDLKRGASLKE